MPEQRIEVPADSGGERLDTFLTSILKVSRSKVQKLIRDGFVVVEDEQPTVHRWLKAGESIVVREREAVPIPPPPSLTIVAETDDYLIIHKPAGIIVHPAAGSRAPTLTSALIERYPELVNVGTPGRPGIVHRLDRDVSGVMVVAKTSSMYDALTRQFRGRTARKRYTALVHGLVERETGTIRFAIGRSLTHRGRMAARPEGGAGRKAETRFTVIGRRAPFTLLDLEIMTGRTHQIRAHLKAIGHAIVGDELYGTFANSRIVPGLGRLFLQSTDIGFHDLAGAWREFSVPLDPALTAFLRDVVHLDPHRS